MWIMTKGRAIRLDRIFTQAMDKLDKVACAGVQKADVFLRE